MSSENIQISDTEQGKVLKCPDYFDISQAAILHDKLQQLIVDKPARVILDSADVETVDAVILQTLYVFIRDAGLAGIDVSWQHENKVVCQAAQLLGMVPALQLQCK